MKRFVVAFLAVLLVPALAGLASGATESAAAGKPGGEVTVKTVYTFSADRLPNMPVYENEVVREKFGIVFDIEYIASTAYTEKLNLYFASASYPDYVFRANQIADLHRWALEGHVVPMSDLLDRLPEYMKHWDPEDWKVTYAFNKSPDGKLYFLPGQRPYQYYMTWLYRKDRFEKAGVAFPKTTDELRAALAKLKQAYPQSIPIINQYGIDLLTGFSLAFRTNKEVHEDLDTRTLVYGPVTKKYRDMLIYVSDLYKKGYIDREWLTMKRAQWQETHYKQLTPLIEYEYASSAPSLTANAQKVDPQATWDWSRTMIVADPSKPQMVVKWGNYKDRGPFLTVGASKEKVDRMIQYFNWAFTEEGQLVMNYGKPGVTMEFVDGKPKLLEPGLKEGWRYALNDLCFMHPQYQMDFDVNYGLMMDLAAAQKGMQSLRPIPWEWTKDEGKARADIGVVIKDTHDTFAAKFVNGDLDPANDAHWKQFTDALDKGGLPKYLELYRAAFGRITW